jgi:hypothetical protein
MSFLRDAAIIIAMLAFYCVARAEPDAAATAAAANDIEPGGSVGAPYLNLTTPHARAQRLVFCYDLVPECRHDGYHDGRFNKTRDAMRTLCDGLVCENAYRNLTVLAKRLCGHGDSGVTLDLAVDPQGDATRTLLHAVPLLPLFAIIKTAGSTPLDMVVNATQRRRHVPAARACPRAAAN